MRNAGGSWVSGGPDERPGEGDRGRGEQGQAGTPATHRSTLHPWADVSAAVPIKAAPPKHEAEAKKEIIGVVKVGVMAGAWRGGREVGAVRLAPPSCSCEESRVATGDR